MTATKQGATALTKERICQTAMSIADEQGLDSLSMRKLAKELNVEAMSLYHHVKNKDEIFGGMVEEIFRKIVIPEQGDWKTRIRQKAEITRKVMLGHPWALGLMDSQGEPGLATLEHHNKVLGIFKSGGFSIRDAAHAFALIDSYVYGFVLQEMSLPFQNSSETQDVATDIMEQMPTDIYPHLAELVSEQVLQKDYKFADEFDFGLELILEGLERVCSQ